jgi:uncharacterized protein
MPALPRDNNPAELAAYEAVCRRLQGFDLRCSLGWVDGFLTGLAAAPPLPDEETWLQACTEDAFDRTFADPQDRNQALRALRTRLSVLADQLDPEWLLERPEELRLNPIFDEWTDEGRQQLLDAGLPPEQAALTQSGADWAAGFLQAMNAFPTRWQEAAIGEAGLREALPVLSSHLQALTWAADSAERAAHIKTYYEGASPPDHDTLLNEAFFAVQDLRVWQLDAGPAVQTRRVDKLPGRNDPCPCGSGKKFKKCHGA